jgi:hypothetical protein
MINFTKTEYPSVVGGAIVKVPVSIGVGTTLFIRNDSEQIMSDIWEMVTKAFYWDGKVIREQWLDNDAIVEIDADFGSLLPEIESAEFAKFLNVELENAEYEAKNPAKRGRLVRVVGGRDKALKGKEGRVVVVKEMQYGMGYRSVMRDKLGIALDDEKVTVERNGKVYENYKNMIWVWAHNCEVVTPEPDVFYAEKCAKARTESYMSVLKNNIARSIPKFGATVN